MAKQIRTQNKDKSDTWLTSKKGYVILKTFLWLETHSRLC